MAFTDRYLIIDTEILVNRICVGMKLYLMNEVNNISNDRWSSLLGVIGVERRKNGKVVVQLRRPHDGVALQLEIDKVGRLFISEEFQVPIGFPGCAFFVEKGLKTSEKNPICSFCQVPTKYELGAEICPHCGWNYTQAPIERV